MYARDKGRLIDPAGLPFRPRLRFDDRNVSDPPRWWNGFLYSWYQLLICPELDGLLCHLRGWRTSGGTLIVRLPDPGRLLLDRAARFRTMAIALAVLEARYLPALDPEWVHLSNADVDEWQRYRDGFDPVAVSAQLGYSAELARRDGEWLLLRAHSLDPVGNSWSRLMRRAPSRAREELRAPLYLLWTTGSLLRSCCSFTKTWPPEARRSHCQTCRTTAGIRSTSA